MLTVFILFLSGVVFTIFATWLLFRKKLLIASVNGTFGISLLSTASVLALVLLNLNTYARLTSEQLLAVVEIGSKSSRGTPINVMRGKHHQTFYIDAKEWQIDARFLKWKYWAYLLGKEPVVRLEGLRERFPSYENRIPAQYNFDKDFPVLSEWGSAISDLLGMVDSYYGSAVYMPVVQGATYTVSATTTGLIARAKNMQAKNAVAEWMRR